MSTHRAQREIVVLEDEPSTRFLLRNVIEGAGYVVHETETVQDALQVTTNRVPNVVLVDLTLQKETGYNFLKQLKKVDKLKEIPVIIVTGTRQKEAFQWSMSYGAIDYLIKPFDPSILIRKIKKAIHRAFPMKLARNVTKDQCVVKLQFKGSLVEASDSRCLVESPVKLAEGMQIRISSPQVSELGWDDLVFVKSRVPAWSCASGQYCNDLLIAAQDARATYQVQQKLKEWKNE